MSLGIEQNLPASGFEVHVGDLNNSTNGSSLPYIGILERLVAEARSLLAAKEACAIRYSEKGLGTEAPPENTKIHDVIARLQTLSYLESLVACFSHLLISNLEVYLGVGIDDREAYMGGIEAK